MFIKVINMKDQTEMFYDCMEATIHHISEDFCTYGTNRFVLDIAGHVVREVCINAPCQIIYMNDQGKTIDRKIFEEGIVIKQS